MHTIGTLAYNSVVWCCICTTWKTAPATDLPCCAVSHLRTAARSWRRARRGRSRSLVRGTCCWRRIVGRTRPAAGCRAGCPAGRRAHCTRSLSTARTQRPPVDRTAEPAPPPPAAPRAARATPPSSRRRAAAAARSCRVRSRPPLSSDWLPRETTERRSQTRTRCVHLYTLKVCRWLV